MRETRHCNVVLVSVIDIWLPDCIKDEGFALLQKSGTQ